MKGRTFSAKTELVCFLAILCGIAFNLVCSLPNDYWFPNSPLYLDTIGTIAVSGLAGIFPGIVTGVATNVVKIFAWDLNPYYAILSAAIAFVAAFFFHNNYQKKVKNVILLILALAFIGGIPGTWVTWMLSGEGWEKYVQMLIDIFSERLGFGHYISVYLANFMFDIIDKTVSVILALFIMSFVPERLRNMLWNSGLKQEYVPSESRKSSYAKTRRSLNFTMISMITLVTIISVGTMTWVSYVLYGRYARETAVSAAQHAVERAKNITGFDEFRECVNEGEVSESYAEIRSTLGMIKDITPGLVHLYLMCPSEDGMRIVFDVSGEEYSTYSFGQVVPYYDELLAYKEDLLRGEEIDGVESHSNIGKVLTVLEPIKNQGSGVFLCYVGGDVDIPSLESIQNIFVIRVILITAALLVVMLSWCFRLTRNRLILPVNSMAFCANEFISDYETHVTSEEARRINRLKIKTGDEIENLYEAFRKMAVDTVAHERNMRKQTETITRMQNGLIVILADMVENRDNDTGNHVKRTAGYVRIIMEGLKKKGYYVDQLTERFMSDVIQSAPLHDLGKIGISDTILNKPGKLTPEEFEIMKRHTVIGSDILGRAISEIHGESYLREARNLAHYHHEKWAGGGYPEGLSGENIPLSARIMAIADVFDAVSQKRVYKEAFSFEQSVEIIYRDSGLSFDPKCVEAFLDSLDEIKEVLESDGEEDVAV